MSSRTLLISYDLGGPVRNYPLLFEQIKSYNGSAPVLESLWLVTTDKTPATVRDELNAKMDANDKVLVMDVTNDAWATNFTDANTEWMHKHVIRSLGLAA